MTYMLINNGGHLLFIEVPADDIDAVAEHGEILETRSIFGESGQSEQDPERALVGVDTQQRVFVLESSLTDEVVWCVREKFAVNGCHPRKLLQSKFLIYCKRCVYT